MEPTIETRDELEWELRDEELDRMGGDVHAARFSAGTQRSARLRRGSTADELIERSRKVTAH